MRNGRPQPIVLEDRAQRRDFTIYLAAGEPLGLTLALKRSNIIRGYVGNKPVPELARQLADILGIIGTPERRERGLGFQPGFRSGAEER